MEIIIEFICEFLLEATVEGTKSNFLPKPVRYILLGIITLFYLSLIALLVYGTIHAFTDNNILFAIVFMLTAGICLAGLIKITRDVIIRKTT